MKCKECGYDLPANGGSCRVCRRLSDWEVKGWQRSAELLFPKRIINNLRRLDITLDKKHIQDIYNGKGLFLYGVAGSGKTLYASALAMEIKKCGLIYPDRPRLEMKFTNCLNLLEEIRASFGVPTTVRQTENYDEEAKTTKQILDYYSSVPLLILDDLGAERPTDWSLQIIHIIINNRYEEVLPTIITSNLGLDALSEQLDDRLSSRIYEMCRLVSFGEKDHRLETKE